ncbi:MAG TPA: hypothetical protein VF384_11960 [Planctomycetota bacterium]
MLTVLTAFVLAASGQDPPPPAEPQPTTQPRFVDFSADLDRASVSVHLGRLGKLTEGTRQPLPDRKPARLGSHPAVSGTQFFKVEATSVMKVQRVLRGIKPGAVKLTIELQVARAPDGAERRQLLTGNGADVGEDMFGLFVFEQFDGPLFAGPVQRLLHTIPFDPRVDTGADGERVFAERMHDVFWVNEHMAALRRAITAVDAAQDGEPRAKAQAELRQRVAARPKLKSSENEPLFVQHVVPLERTAAQRLDGGARRDK